MEIKLKAWQKFHKKMIDVTEIRFDGSGKIKSVSTYNENQCPRSITYSDINEDFRLERDGESCLKLLQYTGLKDKNGVEIYEGDMVETVWNGEVFAGVVVYDLSEVGFKVTDGKEEYGSNFQYLAGNDENEVIGNIYQNKELLESKKD